MQRDFHKEFELAQHTIIKASDIVLSYFEKALTVNLKDETMISSIVTRADEEAELFIRKTSEKQFSIHGFIGEESDEENKETSWVVDPVDGTLAFARGLPEFGMAITLKVADEVVFSVQYLPYFKKLYTAYSGEGAYMNGSKISASPISRLDQSIISVHERGTQKTQYREYALSVLEKYTVRMTHSAVVESCYLAEGKIEALIKFDQKIWDLAPEYRLMTEAGAIVTDEFGKPVSFNFSKSSHQTYIAVTASISESERKNLYFSHK